MSDGPRFEFRIFGNDLRVERERLATLATAGPIDQSNHEYLVAPGMMRASFKLRDGALDLKKMIERRGNLELWTPVAKAALPLSSCELTESFLVPAGLRLALPPSMLVTREMLIDLGAAASIRFMKVVKQRRRYDLNEAMCEWVAASFDCGPLQSIAIEHSNPAVVEAAADQLGVAGWANTSYPRKLHDMAFGAAA